MVRSALKKFAQLKKNIATYENVLIAFSGGVDSTFLLKAAIDTLGKKKVIALTARGQLYPSHETKEAQRIAKKFGVKHITIDVSIAKNKRLLVNPRNRCYLCKKALLKKCITIAKRFHIHTICDAANVDDVHMYRPGNKAARELKIKRPLVACGLHKKEIRMLSRMVHLSTWNKPSSPCLATRFPYGKKIVVANLRSIDEAEAALRNLGIVTLRLRSSDNGVRIEVGKDEIHKFMRKSFRENCIRVLKRIGFHYITLDLEGYRSGSMDEVFNTV